MFLNLFAKASYVQTGNFSLTNFICSCVGQKIDNFSLPRSLCSKAGHASFSTRKICSYVYGCQEKFEIKCTRNTSMVLANKRQPWREINV